MKPNYLPFLFIGAVLLLSFVGYAAIRYSEKVNPALPYFGNGKMETNLADAQANHLSPVPAFSFINQAAQKVDESFTQNKVWIADFFFTRCGSICPKMSNNLIQIQRAFGDNKDLKILSFTCDPEHDDAAQLSTYANAYHANGKQWQFATGSKQTLYRFARKGLNLVATDGDGGATDFIHSQNVVLIDKHGYIRGYYDGTNEQAIEQLINDIKKIL